MQQGGLPVGLHVPHGTLSPGGWLRSLHRLLAKHLARLNWSTAPSDRTLRLSTSGVSSFGEPHSASHITPKPISLQLPWVTDAPPKCWVGCANVYVAGF